MIRIIGGSLLAGLVLGAFFFGSLWLSVQRISRVRFPGLLMITGFLVRAGLSIVVFYALAQWGGWQGVLLGIAGFVFARYVLVRCTPRHTGKPSSGVEREI